MPAKFIRCVRKVKKEEIQRYGFEKYNPYAVCRKSTKYFGPSKDIGLIHPLRRKK